MVSRVAFLSGCHGKVSYGTWAKAKGDAIHLKKKYGRYVEPFHCKHCGAIHLGGRGDYVVDSRSARQRAFTKFHGSLA